MSSVGEKPSPDSWRKRGLWKSSTQKIQNTLTKWGVSLLSNADLLVCCLVKGYIFHSTSSNCLLNPQDKGLQACWINTEVVVN